MEKQFVELEETAGKALAAQGFVTADLVIERSVDMRASGSDTALTVPFASLDTMCATFEHLHRRQFGFGANPAQLIVAAIGIEAIVPSRIAPQASKVLSARPVAPLKRARVWFDDQWLEVPVIARDDLEPGEHVEGPALIVEPHSTVVLESQWRCERLASSELLLSRAQSRAVANSDVVTAAADPVLLEVFNGLFMHIAEQMGAVLEHTSVSVNIKERLDFSCALFDGEAGLIANAPHMPVHLGSMGASVQHILEANQGAMRPGDVFMLNAPYQGGTHLPDITVITPVFIASGCRGRILRRLARPPCGDRWHYTRIDAATQSFGRRRGCVVRQLPPRKRGPVCGARTARAADSRTLPLTQPRSEPRRPQSADRRQ